MIKDCCSCSTVSGVKYYCKHATGQCTLLGNLYSVHGFVNRKTGARIWTRWKLTSDHRTRDLLTLVIRSLVRHAGLRV